MNKERIKHWPLPIDHWLLTISYWLFLVGLFFHKLAFSNLILARGDTFLYFYPYWHAAQEALRAGRLPLWNGDIFMGAPLLANSQMGFFYPLNWPLWLGLDVPYAVSATIVGHVLIAGLGTAVLARQTIKLSWTASLFTAVLFALGGYFTAQVEHINQIQGLAWLPWLLWATSFTIHHSPFTIHHLVTPLFFALQLLAGHTQTAFISGVAVALFIIGVQGARYKVQGRSLPLAPRTLPLAQPWLYLLLAVLLALLLASAQLLPTLELTSFSSREGGLTTNEVLSFSLHPLLLTRSLLPLYGHSIFTEYVAFVPLTALLLAFTAVWSWRTDRRVWPLVLLTAVGLFLALGRFNGLSYLLAQLPGFDLFRAQARWLVVYALGLSLLAGIGLDGLRQVPRRAIYAGAGLLLLLIAWGFAAPFLAQGVPTPPEAPIEVPGTINLIGWLGELALALFLLTRRSHEQGAIIHHSPFTIHHSLFTISIFALFLASRALPYNNPTTPEAYFDQRPPSLRLQAANEGRAVHGRVLSLSNIFFDPGDQGEIRSIYADQLSEQALYDYIVAIKAKEIIAPNLPMIVGTPSLDGFDGGILPLRSYSELMSRTVLGGQVTTDGRLREYLTAVPDPLWLDWFNVRFLITDKTGDEWINGIYYDTQHPVTVAAEQRVELGYVPPFTATAVLIRTDSGGNPPGQLIGLTSEAGRLERVDMTLRRVETEPEVWLAEAGNPVQFESLMLEAGERDWEVRAVTLLNGVTGAFHTAVPGNYRLVHSGDVKIYENLDVLPRVFGLADSSQLFSSAGVQWVDEVVSYEAGHIVVRTNFAQPTMLVVTEAFYPGWVAQVGGVDTAVFSVADFFIGVELPAGRQEVVLEFAPQRVTWGMLGTAVGILLWFGLVGWAWRRI